MSDSPKKVQHVHVDAVLPPDGKGKAPTGLDAAHASEISRIIAHWMDEFIHIPGTKIRIGLDPIIGLIPAVGGLLSSSVSLVVLVEGVRHGVPVSVLARMGLNILINNVLDAIPVIGDAASVFFRSNTMNLVLLNRWKAGEKAAVKKGSRVFVVVFFFLWLGLMAILLTLWAGVLAAGWKLLKGLM